LSSAQLIEDLVSTADGRSCIDGELLLLVFAGPNYLIFQRYYLMQNFVFVFI
jgi:hypothetical protein